MNFDNREFTIFMVSTFLLKFQYSPDDPFISMARRLEALITPRTNRPSNGTYISEISN